MDSIYDDFINSLVNPINKKKFERWIDDVAQKITKIAVDLDDDKLIKTILDDDSFGNSLFCNYDDTLLQMFLINTDIEKAAYEILDIMLKNKKQNES